MGADKADEILDDIVKRCPNTKLIGITCMDDRRFIHNYQFFNDKVLENALCLMKLNCSLEFELKTSFGLVKKQGDIFDFELNSNKRLVQKINGEKATKELFDIVGVDQENIRMLDKFYSQSFYFPFGCTRNDFIHAYIIAGILGEKLYFANQVNETKLNLFQLTGRQILKSTENLFANLDDKSYFNFLVMCETYIETLGGEIYKIYDMIKNKTEKPFIVLFAGGESISYGDEVPHYLYESLNSLTIKNSSL